MTPVTKTFLPPIDQYQEFLQQIWNNAWLTNRGEMVVKLERELQVYLNSGKVILTTNGTIPIQIALKLCADQGEVITTPFSYVATTSAIVWGNCSPVFVDIHPEYLTIDETKIEAAITEKTTTILATHVFGNPCHVEEIERIASKYELKVIYDAAHCFGVKYKEKSLFDFGDISTCSFHATKIFHTGEGGAIFCKNEDLFHQLYFSHNFGHNGPLDFFGVGINAKMSELQGALGLSVLPYMEEILGTRQQSVNFYNHNLDFQRLKKIRIRENTSWNYSYYPVIFEDESALLKVQKALNDNAIFPRRYFYPSLNTLKYVAYKPMNNSEYISSRILCLPLFANMDLSTLQTIVGIINQELCL